MDPVTIETARFIHQISSTSQLTLQMLIGAGGLTVLTTMVSFGAYIIPRNHCAVGGSTSHSLSRSNSLSHMLSGSHSQSPTQSLTPMNTPSPTPLSISRNHLAAFNGGNGLSRSADNAATAPLQYGITSLKLARSPTAASKGEGWAYGNAARSPPGTGAGVVDADTAEQESSDVLGFSQPTTLFQQRAVRISQSSNAVELDGDPANCMHIFQMGLDCISQVFSVQSSRTRDFCRLFVKLGLLQHLAVSFQNILFLYLQVLQKNIVAAAGNGFFDGTGFFQPGHQRNHSGVGSLIVDTTNLTSTGGGQPTHGSSVQSMTSHQETDDCPERKYTAMIANLFFSFSRSDSVVAEMMVKSDGGVIKVIVEALSATELRVMPTATPSHHHFQSSPHHLEGAHTLSSANLTVLSNELSTMSVKRRSSRTHSGLAPAYIEIVELLLKCCKNLSMVPSILDDLENAGLIETLIPLLQGPISDKCKNHVLPCIFNMCRINKKRQEKAALLGACD